MWQVIPPTKRLTISYLGLVIRGPILRSPCHSSPVWMFRHRLATHLNLLEDLVHVSRVLCPSILMIWAPADRWYGTSTIRLRCSSANHRVIKAECILGPLRSMRGWELPTERRAMFSEEKIFFQLKEVMEHCFFSQSYLSITKEGIELIYNGFLWMSRSCTHILFNVLCVQFSLTVFSSFP